MAHKKPAPAKVEPTPILSVTNCIVGTRLSLADGRTLNFGESAEVSEEEAAYLRERGQVE